MRLVIVWLTFSLWVEPAFAGTVAIVRRPNPTAALIEALSRIHGELLSVGLDVKMIERPSERERSEANARAWLEAIAASGQIDAVVDVVGELAPTAADVWVIEKAPRRLAVSRIALEPNVSNASETLAIRAVEVLRSTFLERDMVAREQRRVIATPPIAAPAAKPTPAASSSAFPRSALQQYPAGHSQRLGVAAGAAILTSLDGIGPAIMPIARLDWGVRSWLQLQAALAGLGTHTTVSGLTGSAWVAQEYGILGGCFGLHSQGAVQPFFVFSAGALRTAIEGHAELPRQEHDAVRWSLLFDAGIGAALSLTERYHLRLAVHAQMAEPYVAIHIIDKVVATSGRPNLGLTLTMGAWL